MNQTPWRTSQTKSQFLSKQRTNVQNRAFHKYCELKANQLNDCGIGMKEVIDLEVNLEWTPASFKEYFKAIMKKSLLKSSTTELTTSEINKVYLELEKHLAEKLYVESIPFPTNEPEMKA